MESCFLPPYGADLSIALHSVGKKYPPYKITERCFKNHGFRDFPGGPVVKNPPSNAGDAGLSSGSGRFHMLGVGGT